MRQRFLKSLIRTVVFIILLGCGLTCIAVLTIGWWGPKLGTFLSAPDSGIPPTAQDAIVVLGGSTEGRMITALEVYRQTHTPYFAVTGYRPDLVPGDETVTALKKAYVSGIPKDAITLLESNNTAQDADAIVRFVQDTHVHRVLIVSDWYHGRRAVCSVKQRMDKQPFEVDFRASVGKSTASLWWQSEDEITSIPSELLKLGFYALNYHLAFWSCFNNDMNIPAIAGYAVLAGLLSFVVVSYVRRQATRLKVIDVPNARSSHTQPVPRGGGLGIVVATFAIFLLAVALQTIPLLPGVIPVFVATGLVATIGWFDDRATVAIQVRLILQAAIAVLVVLSVGAVTALYIPLIGTLTLAPAIALAVSVVWVDGFLNEFNFMDGIDGLAGTQTVITGFAWFVLFAIEGERSLATLSALLAAASAGFLILNAAPARIFMGDVGSTFLGAMLAILPILAYSQLHNARLLITGVLFVAPFVFDATLTIIMRFLKGENVLRAHRSHLYQRLVQSGYSHSQVAGLYGVLAILGVFAGLVYYGSPDNIAAAAPVLMLIVLTIHAFVVIRRTRKVQGRQLA